MKTVLIVDDESMFLASLVEGLAVYQDEFKVITASNGRQAVEAFAANNISLVVTDLKMPVMDGFQLLAYLMSAHPQTPAIVMTAFGTPEIEDCIRDFETFGYLEKPIDFQLLADTIRVGINPQSSRHLPGITLTSFLQLLEGERKTCFLKIKSEGRRGNLYFSEGELFDATHNNLTGDLAAAEIVNWQNAEIEISNIFLKLRRRVEKPLRQILLEAGNYQRRDNNQLSAKTEARLPGAKTKFESIESEIDRHFSEILIKEAEPKLTVRVAAQEKKSQTKSSNSKKDKNLIMANNINESINELMQVDGAIAVALVDARSGMALGSMGSGFNLEVAAAGNSEVIKSKLKVMGNLGLKDKIEDILISLTNQYHLMRPLSNQPNLFFYLVLNRSTANLAMARFKLSDVEGKVEV